MYTLQEPKLLLRIHNQRVEHRSNESKYTVQTPKKRLAGYKSVVTTT